jgi:hypothetical protein
MEAQMSRKLLTLLILIAILVASVAFLDNTQVHAAPTVIAYDMVGSAS